MPELIGGGPCRKYFQQAWGRELGHRFVLRVIVQCIKTGYKAHTRPESRRGIRDQNVRHQSGRAGDQIFEPCWIPTIAPGEAKGDEPAKVLHRKLFELRWIFLPDQVHSNQASCSHQVHAALYIEINDVFNLRKVAALKTAGETGLGCVEELQPVLAETFESRLNGITGYIAVPIHPNACQLVHDLRVCSSVSNVSQHGCDVLRPSVTA